MKKIIGLVLMIGMLLLETAFAETLSTNNEKMPNEEYDAIITFADGTVENTSLQNVLDILDNNSLKFDMKYIGASVVAYGHVQDIGGWTNLNGHEVKGYLCVGFADEVKYKNGGYPFDCWRVEVSEEDLLFASELNLGDVVKVSGTIWTGFGRQINMYIVNDNTTQIEIYDGSLEKVSSAEVTEN